ncbi:hypothetical protein DPMN_088525 [Dreissena polymorpha]|uniref:Uncharacterized protein n=1 Tax=Dreissena polymorpha TaxID=45954 RepID=A0A9D4QWG9_DREPO|nr:hypothetical protein DPMN_088525 [Dreissena polymorpha]
MKDNSEQTKFMFKFHGKTELVQYLSELSGLGILVKSEINPNRKINISGKRTDCSIEIPGEDGNTCRIRSICCLLDGQSLLADSGNNRLKLLDQNYRLVSHCPMPPVIHDICHVDSYQLAAAHSYKDMQMFTVGTGKLVMGMNYQLTHS